MTSSLKLAKAAQIALNAAMAANPIGVITVAVVALGAAIAGYIILTDEAGESTVEYAATIERTNDAFRAFNKETNKSVAELTQQFAMLESTNVSQTKKAKIMDEINTEYGDYIGFMINRKNKNR